MPLTSLRNTGVQAALAAAVLFGAGTPIAKLLLTDVSPWMLAGLLYLGSGIGLGVYRLIRRAPRVRLERHDLLPLTGAVFFGGVVGPVLLMFGLVGMPASATGIHTRTLSSPTRTSITRTATTGIRTRRHSVSVGSRSARSPGEWSVGRAAVVVQP